MHLYERPFVVLTVPIGRDVSRPSRPFLRHTFVIPIFPAPWTPAHLLHTLRFRRFVHCGWLCFRVTRVAIAWNDSDRWHGRLSRDSFANHRIVEQEEIARFRTNRPKPLRFRSNSILSSSRKFLTSYNGISCLVVAFEDIEICISRWIQLLLQSTTIFRTNSISSVIREIFQISIARLNRFSECFFALSCSKSLPTKPGKQMHTCFCLSVSKLQIPLDEQLSSTSQETATTRRIVAAQLFLMYKIRR